MKTPILAATALLSVMAALPANAAWPWSRPQPAPPHHYRGHGQDEWNNRSYSRIEARAQARLRQLGYYRGPIDGDFGRGSRTALARFQRDRGLRPTGHLDRNTIRALRL